MKNKEKDKLPNITDENEHEYWIEFKKTQSYLIREALVIKYAYLVKYAASRINIILRNRQIKKYNIVSLLEYAASGILALSCFHVNEKEYIVSLLEYAASGIPADINRYIEFDDLVGFGSFGLLDAIDKYNPNKDIKFKTYALIRITGSIYDALRTKSYIPKIIYKEAKEIEDAKIKLETKLKRTAKPEEIASMLGITVSEYYETMGYLTCTVVSLYDISGIAFLKSSDKTNPVYIAESKAITKEIVKALKELPEKEQQVLLLYYYQDLTLKEIGKALNVSKRKVSQIHTKAIQKLRHSLSQIKKSLL